MPLSAIIKGQLRGAWEFTPDQWAGLRAACGRTGVRPTTECCAQRASVKLSSRGTQFFAHITRGDCSARGETEAHIEAKMAMVRGALAAGWTAHTEVRIGDGDAVADVLAERGRRRVALEAQWSRATLTDLLARQKRYKTHGVSGVWFVRHGRLGVSKALPAFLLTFEDGEPTAVLDNRRFALDAFTTLLLRERIRYRTSYEATGLVEVEVRGLSGTCNRCGARVQLASNLAFGPVLSACRRVLRPGGPWHPVEEQEWRRDAASLEAAALLTREPPRFVCASMHPRQQMRLSLAGGGGSCPRCGDVVHRHHAQFDQFAVAVPVHNIGLPGPHWCVDHGNGHCGQPDS